MAAPPQPDPGAPALGAMFVGSESIEGYERGAARSQIVDSPPRGMVIHWAAQLPDGTITGSLWRERALAEHFMANVLADTFTDLVVADHQHDRPSPDYSYPMFELVDYVAGSDATQAIGRRIGDARGAVLVRPRVDRGGIEYRAVAGSLGLDISAPAGMVAHVAAADDEHVRWIDLWLDPAAPAAFYEAGGIAMESLEVVPLHTLLVNADELAQLPRFPRAKNRLHI